MPPGFIMLIKGENSVQVISNATGKPLPVDKVFAGVALPEGHTIVTKLGEPVVLLFSNGTIATLKANSRLNLKRFRQEEFEPSNEKVIELPKELSKSEIELNLDLGEMVVDLKPLVKGSSFNLGTPLGVTGIRGTRIGMQVRPVPGGGFTSVITVSQGLVAFVPRTIAGQPPPQLVEIKAGQMVSPAVDANGVPTVPAVPVAAPANLLAAINADFNQAARTAASVLVFQVVNARATGRLRLVPLGELALVEPEPSPEEPSPEPEPEPGEAWADESNLFVRANYHTRYYYSSNPLKVKNVSTEDITSWENELSVNLGLGRYNVMDRSVRPSLKARHLRIWNDPGKDHGHKFRKGGYDVDSQSFNLDLNVELAEAWSLNLGYGQSRAINFRTNEVSVYSKTPTVALSKFILLGEQNIMMVNLGTAYNFNKTSAAVDIPALDLLLPAEGSDLWVTNLDVSYMMVVPGFEKLTLSPSFAINHDYYTNDNSDGRQDWTLNYELDATYQLTENLTLQAFCAYNEKTFNGYAKNTLDLGSREYNNLDLGLALSATFDF